MPSFPTIKSGDPQGLVFESPPEPVESLSPWSDFCLRESEPLRVESDGKSEPNCLIEGGTTSLPLCFFKGRTRALST